MRTWILIGAILIYQGIKATSTIPVVIPDELSRIIVIMVLVGAIFDLAELVASLSRASKQ